MRLAILMVMAAVLSGPDAAVEPHGEQGRICVVVADLASDSGQVWIWIHDGSTFVKPNLEKREDAECLQRAAVAIDGRRITWTSEPLPYGEYAVAVHHDVNNDGVINFGKVLPLEAIGYTNYDKGIAAYPDFKAARFTLDAPVREVRLEAYLQGRVFQRRLKE